MVMKQITSIVLLLFVQLKANRLLQQVTTCNGCISPITAACSQFAPCPAREYCTTDTTSPFHLTCTAYPSAQCRFTGCGGCYEYFTDSLGNVVDCDVDICSLPSETGLCRAAFPRYYYNSNTAQCDLFTYGGCGGNANNFETLQDCEAACVPPPVAGDICGTQGNECDAIRSPAFTCPDGETCYGNCGLCTLEDDGTGALICTNMIPFDRVCPASDTKCCPPETKPDGTNGNPLCFEGYACCEDTEEWSCSIGDGQTFSCGNINTNPEHFGSECSECSDLECRNDENKCQTKTCILDPCNDGNNGGCGANEICTATTCVGPCVAICTRCDIGNRLDANGECVATVACDYHRDCDRSNGFKCSKDPECRGRNRSHMCDVCIDKEGRCASDTDCDVSNGYKCVGINNGVGVCAKYE